MRNDHQHPKTSSNKPAWNCLARQRNEIFATPFLTTTFRLVIKQKEFATARAKHQNNSKAQALTRHI
jgi:hypothetical protein